MYANEPWLSQATTGPFKMDLTEATAGTSPSIAALHSPGVIGVS